MVVTRCPGVFVGVTDFGSANSWTPGHANTKGQHLFILTFSVSIQVAAVIRSFRTSRSACVKLHHITQPKFAKYIMRSCQDDEEWPTWNCNSIVSNFEYTHKRTICLFCLKGFGITVILSKRSMRPKTMVPLGSLVCTGVRRRPGSCFHYWYAPGVQIQCRGFLSGEQEIDNFNKKSHGN